MSQKRARASRSVSVDCWDIVDLNENDNKNNNAENPQKIKERRRSLRVLNKKIRLEEKEEASKAASGGSATIDNGTKATTTTTTVVAAATDQTKTFTIKGRTDLTNDILSLFDDITADSGDSNKLTARCTLCHASEQRRSFRKGNISNLKSHIERVNKQILKF